MSQYYTTFAEYATGAQPSDWTKRWASTNFTALVKEVVGVTGGKVLELEKTSSNEARMLSWDAIDADGDRDDVDLVIRYRVTSTSATSAFFGPAIRGAGSVGSQNAYYGSISAQDSQRKLTSLGRYLSGSASSIGTLTGDILQLNEWHWFRIRAEGTAIKLKRWLGSESEPGSWDVEVTNSDVSAAGWVGLHIFGTGQIYEVDFVGAGTNGDSPPSALPLVAGTVGASAMVLPPAITAGAVSLNPGTAGVSASAIAPTVINALAAGLADATASAIAPAVTPGSAFLQPQVADAGASVIAPTVQAGAFSISAGMANAVATAVTPSMPAISNVDPLGGGQYTTIAAWWTAVRTRSNPAQWARCYSGGNLGTVGLSNSTFTPDSGQFPRVFVSDGHGHNGSIGAGAYIETSSGNVGIFVPVNYAEIDGLRVMIRGTSANGVQLQDVNYGLIENCCIVSVDGSPTSRQGLQMGRTLAFTGNMSHRARNNIITVSDFSTSTPYTHAISFNINTSLVDQQTFYAEAINNTVDQTSSGGGSGIRLSGSGHAGAVVTAVIKNNTCARGTCFVDTVTTVGKTYDYASNVSTDATADDEGGSGNLIDQSRTAMWVDPDAHDYRPLRGGPLIDAGADVSGYGILTDILGATRPMEGGTDIGAFEAGLAPDEADATATAIAPTVVVGESSPAPGVAAATGTIIAPDVTPGATSAIPGVADASAQVVAPAIVRHLAAGVANATATVEDCLVGQAIRPTNADVTASCLAPSVQPGGIAIAPGTAMATASASPPTNIRFLPPLVANANASAIAPFILKDESRVAAGVASAAASAAAPLVSTGSSSVAPQVAGAGASVAPPAVAPGAISVQPGVAGASASVEPPAVVAIKSLQPGAAVATATAVDAELVLVAQVEVANAVASAQASEVVSGAASVEVGDAAQVSAAVISPDVELAELRLVPAVADAGASVVAPSVVPGAISISPGLCQVLAEALSPMLAKLEDSGLHYTMPRSRCEYTVPASLGQFSLPKNRTHYTVPQGAR